MDEVVCINIVILLNLFRKDILSNQLFLCILYVYANTYIILIIF